MTTHRFTLTVTVPEPLHRRVPDACVPGPEVSHEEIRAMVEMGATVALKNFIGRATALVEEDLSE